MIKKVLEKYKEVILYLVFGVLTTIFSIAVFAAFTLLLDMNELIANILSWIIAVSFAFLTNRIWVFNSPTKSVSEFFRQMTAFFTGRLATLGIEEVIILVCVTIMGLNGMFIKTVAQVIVIILNYVISKLIVFK